jgi:ribosomal protein S12 methylthiotransferase
MGFIESSRFDRMGVFTYSHEENTHSHSLIDDVPEQTKLDRAETAMELQQTISTDLNQKRIGKVYRVLVDRKEGNEFIGRTEHDSPEVDNEVIIRTDEYLRIGDFAPVKITGATDFDLIGNVFSSN